VSPTRARVGAPRPTWAVLGSGSILPRRGHGPAGYALRLAPGGPLTLFDCGPGTLRHLPEVGADLGDVVRVVLSHYHLDHCLDLFALAFARRNPDLGTVPPLEVIGPRGLGRLCDRAESALGGWARDPDARFVEVDPAAGEGAGLERDGLRLRWVPTGHTPESVAWRADLPDGTSVAYSGDSPEQPALARLAREADLLVCECSHPDGEGVPGHLTPSGAARLAAAAGARRLLLTHFYPAMDPERARASAAEGFSGPVETARDGLVLEL
jgi:ribonuclease BN (tRNA processing enzyme)